MPRESAARTAPRNKEYGERLMTSFKLRTSAAVVATAFLAACGGQQAVEKSTAATSETAAAKEGGPSHVEIKKDENGHYGLYVNGEPFEVKGAGLDYEVGKNIEGLAAAGGNAFRTWRTLNAEHELKAAEEHGLMIAMGLDIGKELHHFDYDDEEAVAKQLEHFKGIVDKYKDHPNLLVWVAGNELNLLFNEDGSLKTVNPKAYVALKELVDYIHEVDPHHPVTTTFAGFIPPHLSMALEHVPNLDFISVQVYRDLENIPQSISDFGVDKPFMVTEYGPRGHWEVPATEWGREVEEPSGVKADGMAERIQAGIAGDTTGQLIGNFAFLWGQKQERTPTWYGMFNIDGKPNARVDEMTKFWTGSYPENRAPRTMKITLDGKDPASSIYLTPGSTYTVEIEVTDPDGDELSTRWTMRKEVGRRSQGGEFEQQPDLVEFEVIEQSTTSLTFVAPEPEGDYRVFAYTTDGKGKVGNANSPFFVKAAQ